MSLYQGTYPWEILIEGVNKDDDISPVVGQVLGRSGLLFSKHGYIYISSHMIFLQGDYISPAEGHGSRMSFALESWQWLTSSLGLDVK